MTPDRPKTLSAPRPRIRFARLGQAALWLSIAAILTSGVFGQTLRGTTHNKEGDSTVLIKLVNGQPTLIDLDLASEKLSLTYDATTYPVPYTYQGMNGTALEYWQSVVKTYANHLRFSQWRRVGADSFLAKLQNTGTESYQDTGTGVDFYTTDPNNPVNIQLPPTAYSTPFAFKRSSRITPAKGPPRSFKSGLHTLERSSQITPAKAPPLSYQWSLTVNASYSLKSLYLRLWRTGPSSWGIKIITERRILEGDIISSVNRTQTGTLHALGTGS